MHERKPETERDRLRYKLNELYVDVKLARNESTAGRINRADSLEILFDSIISLIDLVDRLVDRSVDVNEH